MLLLRRDERRLKKESVVLGRGVPYSLRPSALKNSNVLMAPAPSVSYLKQSDYASRHCTREQYLPH